MLLRPRGCALEPKGYLSIRDENAFWHDLVFQPRYEDDIDDGYDDDPYTACDGCGTLFVRGLEQPIIVCPDLDLFSQLSPPAVEDYVLSVRDLLEE